jgi:hypothetical protein
VLEGSIPVVVLLRDDTFHEDKSSDINPIVQHVDANSKWLEAVRLSVRASVYPSRYSIKSITGALLSMGLIYSACLVGWTIGY